MSNKSQKKTPVTLNEFLSQHPVFTVDELDRFLSQRGSSNPNTRKSLLAYYREQGRIVRVRRGLYATIPSGIDPTSAVIDPYLLTAKMTEDAVLGYHTALEFHGKAYSLYSDLVYVSASKSLPLKFRSYRIKRVPIPRPLKIKGKEMFGVTCRKLSGIQIRVTNMERTFVDVLDRPVLAGSSEEIWRSLESIEFFDLDQVVEYTLLLENSTTAARVGFFLEQHRETLQVDDDHLDLLQGLRPRQPHYLIRRKRSGCRWVKDWNLMIPVEILNRSWGEVL